MCTSELAANTRLSIAPMTGWRLTEIPFSGSQMSITATIMDTATGLPIQKMTFNRMPKPWASFNLTSGQLVVAERIHVGKPAPGKFSAPVEIWVKLKPAE